MGQQHIKMTQSFNAPVDTIFRILTGHDSFGQVINTKIKRVVDSHGDNKNGLGSVRRINAFPAPAFEETVVTFEPNRLMEYVVSKGSPIKNHKGRMEFSDEQGKTRLKYTIDFEPKLPFLFFGSILKTAIEKPIRKGLKKLADQYDNQSNLQNPYN
ncbi:MAG: SRPBCC family protein [Deltaproteobacteria bacterium]|nr:SRPBCC family protein [Deltaproteobacteria bacterium]